MQQQSLDLFVSLAHNAG